MKNDNLKRNCPCCNKELSYSSDTNRNKAEKYNKSCINCSHKNNIEKNRDRIEKMYCKFNNEYNERIMNFYDEIQETNWKKFRTKLQPLLNEIKNEIKEEKAKIKYFRNCPECNKEIVYKTKDTFNRAEQQNCLCASCCITGDKNGFYGKTHSKESMLNMLKTKEKSESYQKYLEHIRSDEHRDILSKLMSGEKNPRYQRPLKKIWIEKYGEEEGLRRWEEWKKLEKESAPKGEDSHNFGKPSPQGSGNGWSGHYVFDDGTRWFFRSFLELSYMVNEIVAKKLKWENGESKKHMINYIDYDGKNRNYFPDFIIDNKYIIECKPINLQNSATVKAKTETAKKYCLDNNMEYIIIEPEKLSDQEILNLYENKKIVFIPKYEKKFQNKFIKK